MFSYISFKYKHKVFLSFFSCFLRLNLEPKLPSFCPNTATENGPSKPGKWWFLVSILVVIHRFDARMHKTSLEDLVWMMQMCFVLFLTASLFDHRKFHVDPVEADIGVISEAIPALEQVWADVNPQFWIISILQSRNISIMWVNSEVEDWIDWMQKTSPAIGLGPLVHQRLDPSGPSSKCSPGAGWCLCPDRQPVWAGPVSEAGAGEMLIWGFPDWFPENKNHLLIWGFPNMDRWTACSKWCPRARAPRGPGVGCYGTLGGQIFIGNLAVWTVTIWFCGRTLGFRDLEGLRYQPVVSELEVWVPSGELT